MGQQRSGADTRRSDMVLPASNSGSVGEVCTESTGLESKLHGSTMATDERQWTTGSLVYRVRTVALPRRVIRPKNAAYCTKSWHSVGTKGQILRDTVTLMGGGPFTQSDLSWQPEGTVRFRVSLFVGSFFAPRFDHRAPKHLKTMGNREGEMVPCCIWLCPWI